MNGSDNRMTKKSAGRLPAGNSDGGRHKERRGEIVEPVRPCMYILHGVADSRLDSD